MTQTELIVSSGSVAVVRTARVPTSHVYFLATQDRRLVKIGVTERPIETRRYEIEHTRPELGALDVLALIPGDITFEHHVHTCFAEVRLARGEWFHLTVAMERWIWRTQHDSEFLEAERKTAASAAEVRRVLLKRVEKPVENLAEKECRKACARLIEEGSVESRFARGFDHSKISAALHGVETLIYGFALACAVMVEDHRRISRMAYVIFHTGEALQDRLWHETWSRKIDYQRVSTWKF